MGIIGAVGASLDGARAGLLSAALAALNPVLMLLPATQYAENLLLLLIGLAFAAAFEAWRRDGLWRWALAGALFGLGLITRPNVVTLLPGVAVGFALALRRQRRSWVAPVLAAGFAALLVISPWTVRNYRVHHHWFFVATEGGRNYWMGNNPEAQVVSTANVLPDSAPTAELVRLPDDMARDRYLYRLGMKFVREHPGRAAHPLSRQHLQPVRALSQAPDPQSCFSTAWSNAGEAVASLVIFLGALLALSRLRRTPALWPADGGRHRDIHVYECALLRNHAPSATPRALPAVDGGTRLGDDAAAPERQSVKRYRSSVKKALEGVTPADLLALGAGAEVIRDRQFQDALPPPRRQAPSPRDRIRSARSAAGAP